MIRERIHWLRTKCSRLFRRRKQEAALNAELRFHFDQLVAQYRDEGMSEENARLAAQREFGAVSVYREEVRDAWRPPELADLWRSLRFAVRSLARSPGFTILAIVTLAFGIGANTVMFSGFTTIMLKPLPYPESAQLDRIDRATPQNPAGRISAADFLDLQREMGGYGEIAAYAPADTSLSEPGQPAEVASGIRITSNFLSTLGIQPQLGRDFRPGEDRLGNDRAVIISQRYWQQHFGGKPEIIGLTIRMDGEPHEIVGVLPASFNDWRHLGWVDVFRPLAFAQDRKLSPSPAIPKADDRRNTILRVIGRRSGNISPAEANSFIGNFGARLAKDFPEVNAGSAWRILPLNKNVQGKSAGTMLIMLIGLSGFVLLIGCSNLANLLARSYDGASPRICGAFRPGRVACAVIASADHRITFDCASRCDLRLVCGAVGIGLAIDEIDRR